MDVSGSLSTQLSALTDALDDPDTDLPAILSVLVDYLTEAVPSFLGLHMTLELHDRPFTLTAIETADAGTARASLKLPLDPLAGAGPGSAVTFYAAAPDAFVNLAADARRAWGLDGQVHLDQHLPAQPRPARNDRPDSSADELPMSVVNRAVAVLRAQGHTAEQARDHLRCVAGPCHISESAAAAGIVQSLFSVDDPDSESNR